ncbi:hypothetical protein ACIU1J_32200 [Azospirillum doebereinerae]|uniref:hypothetical protein n=1 Tax=Azospirillum doebereinerae TaxID=92933 RepID=UPI001EE5A686|nr:hypothetical protein [Azospirillum doebereinerae]MCG5238396.1 hypothetical protein [Azospirillum doebereinerae]
MTQLPTTDGRPDLRVCRDHPVTRALSALCKTHGLSGAVILTLQGDDVSVTSSAPTGAMGAALERVADILLAKFDAGEFDAALGDHSHD